MHTTSALCCSSALLVVATLASGGFAAPLGPGETASETIAEATAETTARIIEIGRGDSQVDQHLEYLTERIGPRLTGSPSMKRASEWAVARFESFGLEARLEKWGEFPVGFERGPTSGGMVSPLSIDFVFATSAWSAGTPGPVRGFARLAPVSLEELESAEGAFDGAWVLERARKERPAKKLAAKIDARLDELGIAGRIANAGALVHTGGRYRISSDDLPTRVTVHLQEEYHVDLRARIDRGEEVELEFDIDNRFLPGPCPQYNVIADLVGEEFPDEYVIVGGHLDSWDGATGAQDNGTGCATTLEAARMLAEAGAKPRRTIRFMLWGGEEQGLLGSRAYVKAHPEEMEQISAVLVHDGGTNYLSGISAPEAMIDQLQEALAPVKELDPSMPFAVKKNEGLSRGGGSDHASFVSAGVPGFFWHQTGRANYRLIHHTQHDLLEQVVPEYQRHSAMVVALGALGIANLDEKLDRTKMIRPGGDRQRDPAHRRMGVQLDGNRVDSVVGGMAAAAGWKSGDRILSIDGVKVDSMRKVVEELQKGGPKKVFRLKRGEETIESVLDYTGSASEKAREKARKKAEQEAKKKAEMTPEEG
jgi:carboxypeptidase Q